MSADRLTPQNPPRSVRILSRRDVVLRGSAALAATALFSTALARAAGSEGAPEAALPAAADPLTRLPLSAGLTPSEHFKEALAAILSNGEPVIGEPLTLTLPELAENGNVVPYTLAVESAMTDNDYVRTLHLLSTANPQALVATFRLFPATGKASVSGRMRLAKTQDVVAIAGLSTGEMIAAVRKVEVTIGGCGNE